MKHPMTEKQLQHENLDFAGTGGRSQENRHLGFKPAFFDFATHTLYPSRFADGRPAPFHLLDGLPDEVIIDRSSSGRAVAAKATVVSGFERKGYFFTRDAAAKAAQEWA